MYEYCNGELETITETARTEEFEQLVAPVIHLFVHVKNFITSWHHP